MMHALGITAVCRQAEVMYDSEKVRPVALAVIKLSSEFSLVTGLFTEVPHIVFLICSGLNIA